MTNWNEWNWFGWTDSELKQRRYSTNVILSFKSKAMANPVQNEEKQVIAAHNVARYVRNKADVDALEIPEILKQL